LNPGGWENYRTVEEFLKFVVRVVSELKDQVDYWITINEPVASIIGVGYIAGLS
jgi:beta-glucosidase